MTHDLPIIQSCRDLGRSLRQWRALHRVKQAHAAELLGVSQATVSRIESGAQRLSEREQGALRRLLAARLSSAADHELARLVRRSQAAMHLVCDATHRLLALSAERERQLQAPVSEIMGRSLWPCASEDIIRVEGELDARGWFGPEAPAIEAETRAHRGPFMTIPASRFRSTRFRLSDGGYARLVETLT